MAKGFTLGRLDLARRRARLRKRSAGAAMFIVAVTLALLAAMGVYGLTSTQNDVRAAGHFRQAAQSQHVAEAAGMAVAETFTPGTTPKLIQDMRDPLRSSNVSTRPCKSANAPTGNVATRDSEACLSFGEAELASISKSTNKFQPTANPWLSCGGGPDTCPFFDKRSFGEITLRPALRVEVTNPTDSTTVPPGMQLELTFTQVTVTVYVDLREDNTNTTTWLTTPPESVALARGRFTVGPYVK